MEGHLFATGCRNLGSYGIGDVRTSGVIPQTFLERDLEDDGLDVLFYFWLVEEDGGGVRKAAAALEAEFRASYFQKATALTEIQFPRDCIPFTAFYKAVLPFEDSLSEAATDGLNDEVYLSVDLLLRYGNDGTAFQQYSKELTIQRSKHLGHYLVTFRYTYKKDLLVIE